MYLKDRNKNKKISIIHKKWLYNLLHNEQRSVSELSLKYCISKGTLNRIKHDPRIIHNPTVMRTISTLNSDEGETIIGCNCEFLDNNVWQFNANDVCKHIALKLKRSLPLYKIRKLMKENLHLSIKRINSRPCFINFEWLHLVRILFSLLLTNFC